MNYVRLQNYSLNTKIKTKQSYLVKEYLHQNSAWQHNTPVRKQNCLYLKKCVILSKVAKFLNNPYN